MLRRMDKSIRYLFLLLFMLPGLCFATEFPGSGDWSSGVKVLDLGSSGQWDDSDIQLGSAVVWRDTVFIFYMGCSTCRPEGDCGYGDIGFAKSSDGVNFTKYSGNPVITWDGDCSPRDDEEVAEFPQVTVTDLDEFVCYWAANSAQSGCGGTGTDVNADVYVSVSQGGPYNFDSGTMVIGGSGDREYWPIGVYYGDAGTGGTTGKWHLWVTGNSLGRTCYLYYGDTYNSLTQYGEILTGYTSESVKPIYHPSDDSMTIIYTWGPGGGTPCYRDARVYTTHIDNLDEYSGPHYTLGSGLCWRAGNAIIADTSAQLWRFYYRYVASGPSDCNGEIWMKTAPGDFSLENRAPTASFTADPLSGVVPLTVDFDASASWDPNGDNLAFDWTVKEGTSTLATGVGVTWQYTFAAQGSYDVFLW